MRTRTFTRRTSGLINTQITFRGFLYGMHAITVEDERSRVIPYGYKANVVIRTADCAGSTSDTDRIRYDDLPALFITGNGAGRTANHANWIITVHACIRYHVMAILIAMPNEPWIVIVSVSACRYAIVTTSAAVQIDDHCLRSVNKTIFHEELQNALINTRVFVDFLGN